MPDPFKDLVDSIVPDAQTTVNQADQNLNAVIPGNVTDNANVGNQINSDQTDFQDQQSQEDYSLKSNDPSQRGAQSASEIAAQRLDPLSFQDQENNTIADPRVWSANDTTRGYLGQIGKGLSQGLGEFVIAGTGDMLQVAGSVIPGISMVEGNVVSRWLQGIGHDFAKTYGTQYVPKEFLDENIKYDYKTLTDPKFWTIKMSAYIPQLAEFFLLSHGLAKGAKVATKGILKGLAKDGLAETVGNVGKITKGLGLGTERAVGQELGFAARNLTASGELGLGANILAESIGGGVGSNLMEGLQNSAQFVNQNKQLLDADGNRLFSDEELADGAKDLMLQNMRYLPIDALSWGITYGKALKLFPKVGFLKEFSKSGRMFSKASQLKTAGNFFANTTKKSLNIISKVSKATGKQIFEGFEETYQEVFQNYIQDREDARLKGEEFEFKDDFFRYYADKRNESTKAISFASGLMGGQIANVISHVNFVAKKEAQIFDRAEHVKRLLRNADTRGNAHIEITEGFINNAEEGKFKRNHAYIAQMQKNNQITEEEAKHLTEKANQVETLYKEADQMNLKGRYKYVRESMALTDIELQAQDLEEKKNSDIKIAEKNFKGDEKALQAKIEDINKEYEIAVNDYANRSALLRNSINRVINGQSNEAFQTFVNLDNEGRSVLVGLNEEEYNRYYKMTDEEILSIAKKTDEQRKKDFRKANSLVTKLSKASKSTFNSFIDKFSKKNKQSETEPKAKDEPKFEAPEPIAEVKSVEDVLKAVDDKTISLEDLKFGERSQIEDILKDGKEVDKKNIIDKANKLIEGVNTEALNKAQEAFNKKTTANAQSQKKAVKKSLNDLEQTFKDNDTTAEKAKKTLSDFIGKKKFESSTDLLNELKKESKNNPELKKVYDALANEEDYNKILLNEFKDNINTDENNVYDFDNSTKKEREDAIDAILATDKYKNKTDAEKAALKSQALGDGKAFQRLVDLANKNAKEKYDKILEKTDKRSKEIKEANPTLTKKQADAIAIKELQNSRNLTQDYSLRALTNLINKTPKGKAIDSDLMNDYINKSDYYTELVVERANTVPAVNNALKTLFGASNIRVQSVIDLYDAVGHETIGYAIGSTIYIDENSWEQNQTYMHEMAHIYYAANPNAPELQKYIKRILENKDLVKAVTDKYLNQQLYKTKDSDGKEIIRTREEIANALKVVDKNLSDEEAFKKVAIDKRYQVLPQEKQEIINEEVFVATLEGPLSQVYGKYFTEQKESRRRYRTQLYWKELKDRAKVLRDEGSLNVLLDEDVIDMQFSMINNFVKNIAGKNIDVGGRAETISGKRSGRASKVASIGEDLDRVALNSEPVKTEKDFKLNEDEYIANLYDEQSLDEDIEEPDYYEKSARKTMLKTEDIINNYLEVRSLQQQAFKTLKNPNIQIKNPKDFRESFYSLIEKHPNNPDAFIQELEDSTNTELQSFYKHLFDRFGTDNRLRVLNSMHTVVDGTTVLPGVIMGLNKAGEFEINTALSKQRRNSKYYLMKKAVSNRSKIEDILNNTDLDTEDVKDLLSLLGHKSKSEFQTFLDKGYILHNQKLIPFKNFIEEYRKDGLFIKRDNGTHELEIGMSNLIDDILNTSAKYSYTSTMENAKGDQRNSRFLRNNITDTFNEITQDLLKLDIEGIRNNPQKINKARIEFLNKYSHISNLIRQNATYKGKGLKHYGNNMLLNMFNNYLTTGNIPVVSVDAGTSNTFNNRESTNTYENSSPAQNNLEDFMSYLNSRNNNETDQFSSLHLFGDSTQKLMVRTPHLTNEQLNSKIGRGKTNKDALLETMFAIEKHALLLDNSDNNLTFDQFKNSIKNDVQKFTKQIETHYNELKNINIFQSLFDENGKLTKEGLKTVELFQLNDMANKAFAQELFLPHISREDLNKRSKMNTSPGMPLDASKNANGKSLLKLEMIPIADIEIRGTKINDAQQYILKTTADKIRASFNGVYPLNHGFKFLDTHQERTNSKFKDRTVLMKGYTTELDEAYVKKYPGLKPIYDALIEREQRYNESMKKKYGPDWKQPVRYKNGQEQYIGIITPTSSDKAGMFTPKQFETLNNSENGIGVLFETNPKAYHEFIDKMYYDKEGNFVGLDGDKLRIQQRMDKVTHMSKFPTQASNHIVSQMHAKSDNPEFQKGILDIHENLYKHAQSTMEQGLTSQIYFDKSSKIDQDKLVKHLMRSMNPEKITPIIRGLLKKYKSISLINDTALNTLINQVKKFGVNIYTPGTYAQQTSSLGYKLENFNVKGHTDLRDYTRRADGGNLPAEIVLSKHMKNNHRSREYFTIKDIDLNQVGTKHFVAKDKGPRDIDESLEVIKKRVYQKALNLRVDEDFGISREQLKSLIDESKVFDDNNDLIGYYVPGEVILATRVPAGHAGFTGVFEVVDFNNNEGNQVMVSPELQKLVGSDFDGDALLINTKSSNSKSDIEKYRYWNEAFKGIAKHWLSSDMNDYLHADLEEDVAGVADIVDNVKQLTGQSNEDYKSFNSLMGREEAFNNGLNASSMIGQGANSQRILNLLAGHETSYTNHLNAFGFNTNNIKANQSINFRFGGSRTQRTARAISDTKLDALSPNERNRRVFQSNVLMQIILDSAKHGYIGPLGINQKNVRLAFVMASDGATLTDIGTFLNHPLVKEFYDGLVDQSNPYYQSKSKKQLLFELTQKYKLDKGKVAQEYLSQHGLNMEGQSHMNNYIQLELKHSDYNSDLNKLNILKSLEFYSGVSDEMQILTNVLSGHNKKGIETNPMVLEESLAKADDLLHNRLSNQLLHFKQSDPRNENYVPLHQSKEYLKYRDAYKEALNISEQMTLSSHPDLKAVAVDYIHNVINLKDPSKFNITDVTHILNKTAISRLFGLNNMHPKEMLALVDYDTPDNVFKALYDYDDLTLDNNYNQELKTHFIDNVLNVKWDKNEDGIVKPVSFELNHNLRGFGVPKTMLNMAEESFSLLPADLKEKIIISDFIFNGFGAKSLLPIYDSEVVKAVINGLSNAEQSKKISPTNQTKLRQLLLNREMSKSRNNIKNVYVKESLHDIALPEEIVKALSFNTKQDLFNGKDLILQIQTESKKGIVTDSRFIKIKGIPKELATIINDEARKETRSVTNNNKSFLLNEAIKREIGAYVVKNIKELTPTEMYPHDIDFLTISDNKTTKNETLKRILEDIEKKKVGKVLNPDEVIDIPKSENRGRSYQTNMRFYTHEDEISRQDYFNLIKNRKSLTESQKQAMYQRYIEDKKNANKLSEKYPKRALEKMSDVELQQLYDSTYSGDLYAYSILHTKMFDVITNREMLKQSKLTGRYENGRDISIINAYMTANNISSNHPATQAAQKEIEIEYEKFAKQIKKYSTKINSLTEELYKEKFGRIGQHNRILNKIRLAVITLIKGKKNIYETVYGNIVKTETQTKDGQTIKRHRLLSSLELESKYKNKQISTAEYNFAKYFKEVTKELHSKSHNEQVAYDERFVPVVMMERMEAFSHNGLLGLLANTKSKRHALQDVKLMFNNELTSFKNIEDYYRAVGGSNYSRVKDFIQLQRKASKYLKKGVNEDGSAIKYSVIQNETLKGDGMINRFANQDGYTDDNALVSLDLNKALHDYTHTTLFVNGNNSFKGFKRLQMKIDALKLHNAVKGFDNVNKIVQKVLKEKNLAGKREVPTKFRDKVLNKLVRSNLIYVLGWKMLFMGKGVYAIGNSLLGKYNTIKDLGGADWLKGESRFWGVGKDKAVGLRKSQGVLKNLNLLDFNIYDEVSFNKKQGLDKVFSDLALAPMIYTENWIQGTHTLGLLTEEQWNSFDDNGNYKPNTKHLTTAEIVAIKDKVNGIHGRGYSPTNQRLIQTYSWGKMLMQFSRFIPTTIHDRFAKADINKYGQEHIGSLRAVWDVAWKIATGEMTAKETVAYRNSLSPAMRNRLDSGLRGLAMATVGAFVGASVDNNTLHQLNRDMNIYADAGKLGWRATPPTIRTINEIIKSLFP